MLDKFVPDKYFKSIYDINYKKLKVSGIKCLVFSITNTLVPGSVKTPTNKVKDLFEDLKDMGFKILLLSNRPKKDVTPFKELLCVDSAYLALKPLKFKYKKIMRVYNFKDTEIACIGSQLFYDVYGANRMEFTSIYVNPISNEEYSVANLNIKIENMILDKLNKKQLFKKGNYYE
jgi:hypothetical protein